MGRSRHSSLLYRDRDYPGDMVAGVIRVTIEIETPANDVREISNRMEQLMAHHALGINCGYKVNVRWIDDKRRKKNRLQKRKPDIEHILSVNEEWVDD